MAHRTPSDHTPETAQLMLTCSVVYHIFPIYSLVNRCLLCFAERIRRHADTAHLGPPAELPGKVLIAHWFAAEPPPKVGPAQLAGGIAGQLPAAACARPAPGPVEMLYMLQPGTAEPPRAARPCPQHPGDEIHRVHPCYRRRGTGKGWICSIWTARNSPGSQPNALMIVAATC
jgi:hypothetical protein